MTRNVVMVGDRLAQRGGIASLERWLMDSAPDGVNIEHIATHDEGSALLRIRTFVRGVGELWRRLRRGGCDVVHIHHAGRGSLIRKSLVIRLVSRYGVAVVAHGHAGYTVDSFDRFPSMAKGFVRRSFAKADAVIALSSEMLDWYADELGLNTKRLYVVHNPAPDVVLAHPRDPGDERVRILCVSRLRSNKGTLDVLDALAHLAPEVIARLDVFFAGDGDIEQARQHARNLGVHGSVRFGGWVEGEALEDVFRTSDVFVMPSHSEGIPLALREAMAHGLACITTNVGGIPEVVPKGGALLIEPNEPAQLADAIRTVVVDPTMRRDLGRRASASASTTGIDWYWRRLRRVYSNVAGVLRPQVGPITSVSIVVPTFNRAAWLDEALRSLTCQTWRSDVEILVVDNGSTDDTAQVVAGAAASSGIIRYVHESTPGDAAARNRGIRDARADWIAFFDDDQIARSDWLEELCRTALRRDAEIVGGAVHLQFDEQANQRFGPEVRRNLFRESLPYDHECRYQNEVLPGGGNLLVRRGVIDEVGSFDEQLNGGSDHDFVRRAISAGVRPWYAPDAAIDHRVGAHRQSRQFVRRESRRSGWALADEVRGPLLAVHTVLRIGQALMLNLPLGIVAKLRRDDAEALDRRVLLWRAEGFVRHAFHRLAPGLSRQEAFIAAHQFAGVESQRVTERSKAG